MQKNSLKMQKKKKGGGRNYLFKAANPLFGKPLNDSQWDLSSDRYWNVVTEFYELSSQNGNLTF